MSKWEELSDFEVNSAVHNILKCNGKYSLKFLGDNRIEWKCGVDTITTEKIPYGKALKDYCNSWEQAGKIIQDQKIWIREISGIWISKGFPGKFNPYNEVSWEDKNPLRAAMIVFLMMNEGKGNE